MSEPMYLHFPSSWGSRLEAEWGQPMGSYELHTPEAVCLSLAMESREEEQKSTGVWKGGLTTRCSEQCMFTAHRERGTTAFPVWDLQMFISALPAGPKPARQAGKALPSLHA